MSEEAIPMAFSCGMCGSFSCSGEGMRRRWTNDCAPRAAGRAVRRRCRPRGVEACTVRTPSVRRLPSMARPVVASLTIDGRFQDEMTVRRDFGEHVQQATRVLEAVGERLAPGDRLLTG